MCEENKYIFFGEEHKERRRCELGEPYICHVTEVKGRKEFQKAKLFSACKTADSWQ